MREEQEAQRAAEGAADSGGNGKPAMLKKEEEGRRKRKGRHQQILEEWDDLANEERLCVSCHVEPITWVFFVEPESHPPYC